MFCCTESKRIRHVIGEEQGDEVDDVEVWENASNRECFYGSTQSKFDEFDNIYLPSELKKRKSGKNFWIPWLRKNRYAVKKVHKDLMKSTMKEMHKLNEEQCIGNYDMIGELKDDKNNREVALEKRSYVLDELVKTERDYVLNLSMVVEGYLLVLRNPSAAEFHQPIPENLKMPQVQNIIFSNIKKIYEFHKNEFLKEIETYSAQPLKISNIFKKNESNFYMYTDYCQKNYIFDFFMDQYHLFFEEMRTFSSHVYPLRDLLIRPVKRIKMYTLLLQEMLKYSIQANLRDQLDDIQQAIDVMKRIIENIDEMMIVDRLQNFKGNIRDQGKMLMHGPLRCVVNMGYANRRKNTYKDRYVFLFERAMIFTAEKNKKKKFINPNYVYKTKIKVIHMILKETVDNASKDTSNGPFLVESVVKNSHRISIVCQAYCAESRSVWLQKLRELVKAQFDFQLALRIPMGCV